MPNIPDQAGAWPEGPYRFDDISRPNQNDGLGYVYLADSGCSPTLAHTGDMGLTAAENRALGNLFAAAPELFEALTGALHAIEEGNLYDRMCCNGMDCGCRGSTNAEYAAHCIRAALSKATGAS